MVQTGAGVSTVVIVMLPSGTGISTVVFGSRSPGDLMGETETIYGITTSSSVNPFSSAHNDTAGSTSVPTDEALNQTLMS